MSNRRLKNNMNKKILKFAMKFAVSMAFVVWLVFKMDWESVFLNIKDISLWMIPFYVIVFVSGMLISAYKWKILAEFKGFQISLKKSFQLYLTGTFINNFMPSFIGGDTYRIYQIGKSQKKYVSGAVSVVLDRLTGFAMAMMLSVVFLILDWGEISKHFLLSIMTLALIFFLLIMANLGTIMKFSIWKKILFFIPEKFFELLKNFSDFKESLVFKKALFFSVVFNLIGLAGTNYILFQALGIQIRPLDYLAVIFLISIVSSIPVSINNIGIKEWAYVTFFGFFGVSASGVIAVALLSRILQMLVSFTALPAYLQSKEK